MTMRVDGIEFPFEEVGDIKVGDLFEDNTNHDTWEVTYVNGPAFVHPLPHMNDKGYLCADLPDGALVLKKIKARKTATKTEKTKAKKTKFKHGGVVEIPSKTINASKIDIPKLNTKKNSVKISKKTDPGYCIVMTSPNKPRKFVVVGTFEEAKLIMANAREKDPFVDFMVFEKISLLDNGNGNILKGMAKAA